MTERIEKLKTFLEKNPADNFIQHALALEYIKAGKPGEARLLFESLLRRDPAYTGSYYHLAGLLVELGERDEALNWYRKGMEAARVAGDDHAYRELAAAMGELSD